MIKEAIILAGGLGTRLQSVVANIPKCLAPINGKPFLFYLITELQSQGIQHFIFSTGYLNEQIEAYLQKDWPHLKYIISKESSPLGTGGAIQSACKKVVQKDVLICNGDTLFRTDINALFEFHQMKHGECTLALTPMNHFERYGAVEIDENGAITEFKEKEFKKSGVINGGVYLLNKDQFLKNHLPEIFSFEKDYLEKKVNEKDKNASVFGMIQHGYFLDIGIPEDYEKAQKEFKNEFRTS